MTLEDLNHIHKKTSTWIDVYVLDTWAVIDSEAEAMLQALHSRSTGGLQWHLEILKKKGADNFMSKFYVWYGHKSIWDCGSITIFIEWVSMLGAKAIQDTKLYNGQEASTRYIDFSKQDIINPLWTPEWEKILETQRSFYLSLLEPLKKYIAELYPREDDQSEKIYNKTVEAKVFDICRWFLPAGCSTNLARHTTLRQVADRILQLRHHPLPEIQEVAETLLEAVLERFPNSFSTKTYEETEAYLASAKSNYYFHKHLEWDLYITANNIDQDKLTKYKDIINSRPNNKTELPTYLDNIGTMTFQYLLDFGSFRDVQRHRAPYQRMPLLTDELWFHTRYLESLTDDLREKAKSHIQTMQSMIAELDTSPEIKQYYTLMWFNMSCEMMWTLPALIYMTELRSTTYVHSTLRQIAIKMWKYIEDMWIKMFLDTSNDEFDTRRGKQDIEIQ